MNVWIVKNWSETSILNMRVFASETDAFVYLSELAGYDMLGENSNMKWNETTKSWSTTFNWELWMIFKKELEGSFEVEYSSFYED